MKTLHTEIGIGAPAAVVWDVISDLDGWSDWNPVMKVAGGLAPGNSIRVSIAAPGGKEMSFEPEIVDVDDGREFRWRVKKYMGLFDAEHGFRIVPEDVGRCRFENFEVFRGVLGEAMYRRELKALETGFQAMNRMLKRETEKRARERA